MTTSSEESEENFNVKDVFCVSVEKTWPGEWNLPTKQIGKGGYGTIYEVCKKTNGCNYVMKIIPFGGIFRTPFYREVNLQKEAAALDIAPLLVKVGYVKISILASLLCHRLKKRLGIFFKTKRSRQKSRTNTL